MRLIGISGAAGSGKDAVAKILGDIPRFAVVSLSDPMKEFCQELFDFSESWLWGESKARGFPDRRLPRLTHRFTFPSNPPGGVWIALGGGQGFAIVSVEDFEQVSQYRWHLNRKEEGKNTNYARSRIGGKQISLHRFIMELDDPERVVDHINGDGLDNRRSNLRVCSKGENRRNSEKRIDGMSPFKGVGWDKKRAKWRAYINLAGELKGLGHFDIEEEAAVAYDTAASAAFGPYARLNSQRFLTPREALQRLGDWGRDLFEDTWINAAIERAKLASDVPYPFPPPGGVVIPDVRYPNEAQRIRDAGGQVWRIVRPGQKRLDGVAGAHASEHSLTDQDVYERMIVNNRSLGELEELVLQAVAVGQ